jgi:predicted TIM-barrel fold metal-dependent hydrolase
MEIIDAHQHVGGMQDVLTYFGKTDAELALETEVSNRVRAMQAIGVSRALLQPSHSYNNVNGIQDTMRINDRMARFRELDPDHFPVLLGTVEPRYGERCIAEVERVKFELKLDGISWHHRFQGAFIDSRWMWPILRRMAEIGLKPVIHVNAESGLESHWRLQRLAKDFPEHTFLAHDGMWTLERAMQIITSASQTPNIIWDFGGPTHWITVEQWVEQNGSRNICFSADIGYGTQTQVRKPKLLSQIENARITEEDKANILGANLRRMFGL